MSSIKFCHKKISTFCFNKIEVLPHRYFWSLVIYLFIFLTVFPRLKISFCFSLDLFVIAQIQSAKCSDMIV